MLKLIGALLLAGGAGGRGGPPPPPHDPDPENIPPADKVFWGGRAAPAAG